MESVGLEHGGGDFFGSLGAHVQHLRLIGKRGVALGEEATDHSGVAGGDAQGATGGEGLEAGIAMGGHLTEIGHGLKSRTGLAELL